MYSTLTISKGRDGLGPTGRSRPSNGPCRPSNGKARYSTGWCFGHEMGHRSARFGDPLGTSRRAKLLARPTAIPPTIPPSEAVIGSRRGPLPSAPRRASISTASARPAIVRQARNFVVSVAVAGTARVDEAVDVVSKVRAIATTNGNRNSAPSCADGVSSLRARGAGDRRYGRCRRTPRD